MPPIKRKKIKNKKERKQAEQYHALWVEANAFNLDQYHTGYVTKMPDNNYVTGKPVYFVVKDIDEKRYGEYRLSAITIPSPINKNLWIYLFRRLSDEIERDNKSNE